jgi:hypothetical protein
MTCCVLPLCDVLYSSLSSSRGEHETMLVWGVNAVYGPVPRLSGDAATLWKTIVITLHVMMLSVGQCI